MRLTQACSCSGRIHPEAFLQAGRVRDVSDCNSKTLSWILFKLGMLMNLLRGHMHVNWIFGPIQDGRLAAILDVSMGPVRLSVRVFVRVSVCPSPTVTETRFTGSYSNLA